MEIQGDNLRSLNGEPIEIEEGRVKVKDSEVKDLLTEILKELKQLNEILLETLT